MNLIEVDRAAALQGGMISHADSTTNEHAIETTNNTTNVTQQIANNVMLTKPLETIQPVQCEICNITCNNKELLEKHKLGKKHTKNLQKIGDSSSSVAPSPPVASAISVGELENKKHRLLQNGASVNKLLYCQICNVVCNNQGVLQKHVAGKKHSAKAIMQQAITNVTLNSTPECSSQVLTQAQAHNLAQAQIQAQVFNGGSQKNPNLYLTLVRCELCKISCTSNELLNMHLSGKKHLRKLKNSEGKMVISQEEEGKIVNSDEGKKKGRRGPSNDDVETKKQKILQTGGASDAIMICTLCNVVCNSNSVYLSHLAGQKHIAMVMKQAEAQGQPTGQTT